LAVQRLNGSGLNTTVVVVRISEFYRADQRQLTTNDYWS